MSEAYKLVIVTWIDSCSDSSWSDIDAIKETKVSECESVGWVVADEETCITIIPNRSGIGDSKAAKQAFGWVCIPRCCITKMTELEVCHKAGGE